MALLADWQKEIIAAALFWSLQVLLCKSHDLVRYHIVETGTSL